MLDSFSKEVWYHINLIYYSILLYPNLPILIMQLGPKRLETKNRLQIGEQTKRIEFNETLSMLATVYKNK